MLSKMLRPVANATPKFNLSFVTSGGSNDNVSTYSFTNVNFGDENSTREIFLVFSWTSTITRSLNSATIGGVSATTTTSSQGTISGVSCVFASVPTGTTGTITATMSGGCTGFNYGVYRVINRSTSAGQTSSQFGAGSYTSPLSDNINTINGNGFALGTYGVNADRTYSSSPYTLDNYNTTRSAEAIWQINVSYINTSSSSVTPTQQITWPSGSITSRWGLWSFNS